MTSGAARPDGAPVGVEAADKRVDALDAGQLPGVAQDVDDAGVAAAGEHDEPLAPDMSDQRLVVQEERGLSLLDDLEAGADQRRLAGGGKLYRLTAGDEDAAAAPELRVDDHRQVGPPEGAGEAIEAGGVVEVAVAEDDDLDVLGRQAEPAHVFDEPVGSEAGVEQQTAGLTRRLDGHGGGGPALGAEGVRRLTAL